MSPLIKGGIKRGLLRYCATALLLYCAAALLLCSIAPDFAFSQPITSIEVTGLYSISEGELLYLLDIHKGKALNKADLRASIKRAFLKGIFDDIIVESQPDGAIPGGVIRVTVKEKLVINSVNIMGNDYFSARFIRKHFGIDTGERLNILKIKKSIESLKNEFKKRGFWNADASYNIIPVKGNRADLQIIVNEGSPEIIKKIILSGQEDIIRSHLRLSEGDIFNAHEMERFEKRVNQQLKKEQFVETLLSFSYKEGVLDIRLDHGKRLNISFSGNSAIPSKMLMMEVPFFEVREFNYALLEEATARIIKVYQERGFPFAQIAPVVAAKEDSIFLEFFIFEGERYIVDSASFIGDITISQKALTDAMTLKPGSYYNPDLLESDRDAISEFYYALGYIFAEVQSPEVKFSNNRVEIKFSINEGQQVRISKITMRNNRSISEEEIIETITLKQGSPYNDVDISDSRRKIARLYNSRGFLEARVTVERDISDRHANILFDIHEGEITLFGKSVITGNERTKEKVMRREFLHEENKPFDYGALLKERRNLYRVGLFTDVEIEPSDVKEREKGTRDVIYRVKEAKAGAVEFGIGYGEYERYRGFFDISYKNLWGMNRQASFRTEFSALESRFMISYYDPWFLDRKLPFKSLLLHERKEEISIDTRETRYKLTRNLASAGIERSITESSKIEFYYDFSVVRTFDVKPDVILSRQDIGTLIISGIRSGLIYDTRDNPFEPRRGILAGASLKIASKFLFSETEFAKLTFYANIYQSLGRRTVLALSLRAGAAEGLGEIKELPIVERFFLGGRTTVRGYEQDTLGPKSADGTPTGGNAFAVGNIELRTDIGRGFGLVGFLDGGNVWNKIDEINMAKLKFTTGIGLRFSTPVGPFRIDYGHKLNRERGESSGEIHFSLGHAF